MVQNFIYRCKYHFFFHHFLIYFLGDEKKGAVLFIIVDRGNDNNVPGGGGEVVKLPCRSQLKYKSEPYIIAPSLYPCGGYACDFNLHLYTLISKIR